jgi:hypothetical protein
MNKLILIREGQEIGKERVCPLHYERVEKEKNARIMYGSEKIADGEMNDGRKFIVFQSANKNVITIECEGFFNHVVVGDIIDKVLLESEEIYHQT